MSGPNTIISSGVGAHENTINNIIHWNQMDLVESQYQV